MVAFVAQPEPGIERDLLVAAAAGVDLVRERAHALLQFADDEGVDVFVGRRLRRNAGDCASSRMDSNACDDLARIPIGVRTPARVSERAKAWEPRTSASSKRRSKWREFEKRSKISEGPVSNRPPQSFIYFFACFACSART